mmetsp:Transcript_132128/g.358804  ORF Transcript_132128/g.358804 Transcript_132128/m.358804 type:complete len:272 (-) Transcript_132128:181-996(-)
MVVGAATVEGVVDVVVEVVVEAATVEVVVDVVVEVVTEVVAEVSDSVLVVETNDVCVDVGFAVVVADVVCVEVSVIVQLEVSVLVAVEETRCRWAARPGWCPHFAPDTAARFRCCSGHSPSTNAHMKHTELRPSTPVAFPQVHRLHSRSFSHSPRHVTASATRPTWSTFLDVRSSTLSSISWQAASTTSGWLCSARPCCCFCGSVASTPPPLSAVTWHDRPDTARSLNCLRRVSRSVSSFRKQTSLIPATATSLVLPHVHMEHLGSSSHLV